MQDKKGNNNLNKVPPNYVHLQSIHAENIKHEYKYENRNKKYDYTFNPYRCKYLFISLSFDRKTTEYSSKKSK